MSPRTVRLIMGNRVLRVAGLNLRVRRISLRERDRVNRRMAMTTWTRRKKHGTVVVLSTHLFLKYTQ